MMRRILFFELFFGNSLRSSMRIAFLSFCNSHHLVFSKISKSNLNQILNTREIHSFERNTGNKFSVLRNQSSNSIDKKKNNKLFQKVYSFLYFNTPIIVRIVASIPKRDYIDFQPTNSYKNKASYEFNWAQKLFNGLESYTLFSYVSIQSYYKDLYKHLFPDENRVSRSPPIITN